MKSRNLLAVMLLVVAVFMSGCMKNSLSKMSLELKQVKIKNFSNNGFGADVYMNIKNPNGFGVTVKDLNYSVMVNDREVGKGRIPAPVEIPANGEALAVLPLEVGPEAIDNLFKHGVNYRIKGEAVFGTLFGSYTYPFDLEKKPKKKKADKADKKEKELEQ